MNINDIMFIIFYELGVLKYILFNVGSLIIILFINLQNHVVQYYYRLMNLYLYLKFLIRKSFTNY